MAAIVEKPIVGNLRCRTFTVENELGENVLEKFIGENENRSASRTHIVLIGRINGQVRFQVKERIRDVTHP